jgi:hypothetical protein
MMTHNSRFGLFFRVTSILTVLLSIAWLACLSYIDPFQGWALRWTGGVIVVGTFTLLMSPLLVMSEYPLSWEVPKRRWRVHAIRTLKVLFVWFLSMDPVFAYPSIRWYAGPSVACP